MNVVMLTPDCFMIDRRIVQEARTLTRAGHHVTILAGFECEKEEQYEIDGISIIRYRYDWDDDRLKRIRRMLPHNDFVHRLVNKGYMYLANRYFEKTPFDQFMISKALEFNADIYHVHDLPCLKAGCYAARSRRVPLIYDAHELYYAQNVLPRKLQRSYRRLEKRYIRFPANIITVNPFIAKLMAERYKIKEPDVLFNCTELSPNFEPQKAVQLLRDRGNIPPRFKNIVLYQGWLSSERNIETIIRGVKWFPADACLAIIGYGFYEAQLKTIALENGVQKSVFFLGAVSSDEILNYTAGADLGVIPYRPIDENHLYCSPNKFFEYVITGVPVIANDLPFFRMMSEQFEIVLTADLDHSESFAKTVQAILENESLLQKMKERCREAAQVLNWESEGKKLLDIYQRLRIR